MSLRHPPSVLSVPVSDGAKAHGSAMSHPGWAKGQSSSPTTRLLAAARVIGPFRALLLKGQQLIWDKVMFCAVTLTLHTHTYNLLTELALQSV